MARWLHENPYLGVDRSQTTSGITSNVVPLWDADAWTLSFRTTRASFSTTTLQLSNTSDSVPLSIAEASWSNYTVLGTVALSGTTWLEGPAGARYARFLSATTDPVIEVSRQARP